MSNAKNLSKQVFNCKVFTIKCDNYFIDKTNNTHDFFVIEPSNWANVIAITEDNQVILVKQFRYGNETITLEIPGGIIDEGESPEIAVQRELLEETGYQAKECRLIGITDPNPAIQNNKCYMFLATGAKLVASPNLDSTEEIEIVKVPINAIPSMIKDGKITHSLVIAAFHYYSLL